MWPQQTELLEEDTMTPVAVAEEVNTSTAPETPVKKTVRVRAVKVTAVTPDGEPVDLAPEKPVRKRAAKKATPAAAEPTVEPAPQVPVPPDGEPTQEQLMAAWPWVYTRSMAWADGNGGYPDSRYHRLLRAALLRLFGRENTLGFTGSMENPTMDSIEPIRPWLTDKCVRFSRDNGYCVTANQPMTEVLGEESRPKTKRRQWLDSEGYDCSGYNGDGLNKDGYDEYGLKGGYDAYGYDYNGFNKDGWSRDGFDRNGFNAHGYDRYGCDKTGYNPEGYDRHGYDKDGYNKDGWDLYGCDKTGYDKSGFDRNGYDHNDFNRYGNHRTRYNYHRRQFEETDPAAVTGRFERQTPEAQAAVLAYFAEKLAAASK